MIDMINSPDHSAYGSFKTLEVMYVSAGIPCAKGADVENGFGYRSYCVWDICFLALWLRFGASFSLHNY